MNLLEKTAPIYDSAAFDVLNRDHTQYLLKGGRGSTKSSFIAIILITLLVDSNNKNVNALVLRKVGNTLKDSVYNQVLWAIDQLGLNAHFKATKNPLEIIYKHTGQKIYFRGADDPLKIKSIKPDKGYIGITWFEELDQFSGEEEIRNILQSTNRGGSVFWNFFSFNPPKSRDNWANQFAEQIRDDRLTVHSTYLDVPREWLGEQFFIEADFLKQTNPRAYEHEYLGVATGTGGAVFDNIEQREITDAEINTFGNFYYGVDFGFALDPFAYVACSYDRMRNVLYIFDEIYQTRLSNSAAADLIKQHQNAGNYITADSAEPKSISDLNERGLKVLGAKKGADSVRYGINWLQDVAKIVIDKKRAPNVYREFSCYEYDTDKYGNFISAFPDKDNHCLTGDTLVNTIYGKVPIEKLCGYYGCLYAYDTVTQRKVIADYCNVRKTRENAEIYRITLENGAFVDCTADHPILTSNRGYVLAAELTKNDNVMMLDTDNKRVKQLELLEERKDVYDLEVPQYHNFAVNDGIIVHNCIDATRYALESFISTRRIKTMPKSKLGVY